MPRLRTFDLHASRSNTEPADISRIVNISIKAREIPRWRSFSIKRREDEYPRRDHKRPLTVVRRPDERHYRPYNKSQRGSYGSRGGFRGARGR